MPRRTLPQRLSGGRNELAVIGEFAWASRWRVASDIVWSRVVRHRTRPNERVRTVALKDGTRLSYRLNEGDVQAVREIWRDAVYMPPQEASKTKCFVDVGANIGFASVYMARRTAVEQVIAVEPDPANAQLLRRNLAQNHINAIVLEAAVSAHDGRASFAQARKSNLGHLDDCGDTEVEVVSMATVLGHVDSDERVLLKIDIEGGEQQLFNGGLSWLGRVEALTIEIHPEVADSPRIRQIIGNAGFHFYIGTGNRDAPKSFWLRIATAVPV